jgi:DNA repair exonuclease SbcCD ATPase subunit
MPSALGQIVSRPVTKADAESPAQEIRRLEDSRRSLEREIREQEEKRAVELQELRRTIAESRAKVEEIKADMSAKLAERKVAHDAVRRKDMETSAALAKRGAEDKDRLLALEREVTALKAAARTGAPPSSACVTGTAEPLPALLARLGLSAHLSVLEDEELDVALLRSMGRDELASNMAQLGLGADEVARLASALGPEVQ